MLEVEVVAHGSDLAVFAFTVLLFKDACTHARARSHKVLVDLQPIVLLDACLCETVQVLSLGVDCMRITALLLFAASSTLFNRITLDMRGWSSM